MIYLNLAAGLIYLLMGGDLVVRGAVALAHRTRVSPMIIALTVVSFGTSLPELVVGIRAAIAEYPSIVLGNVVGSNIANVMLVGGAAATISPLLTRVPNGRRDSAIMVVASLVLLGIGLGGRISRYEGLMLFLALALVSALTIRDIASDKSRAEVTAPIEWVLGLPSRLGMISVFLVAGLVGLPLGARMVVDSAVRIAAHLGISDAAVGLTIVAVSTSLPELATTVVAAMQRRTDVAIGTILGSNVFNILGIMSAATLISPVPIAVGRRFLTVDMPLMVAVALVLSAFVWRGRPLGRSAGILLLAGYALYTASIFLRP